MIRVDVEVDLKKEVWTMLLLMVLNYQAHIHLQEKEVVANTKLQKQFLEIKVTKMYQLKIIKL